MAKAKVKFTGRGRQLPLIVEKGESGFYVVECPFFEGCYAQGKTIDEALHNIREVVTLILEKMEAAQNFGELQAQI